MAEHTETLTQVFASLREPWWNEDILEDVDNDTDRKLDADGRRRKQGRIYKSFPNQAFVEVMFCMVHVFSLIFVPIYLVLGVTLIGWTSSVTSVMQDSPKDVLPTFQKTLIGKGDYDMGTCGKSYCLYGLFIFVNTLLTIKATFAGRATNIKYHVLANFLGFLAFEITMCLVARYYAPEGSCQLGLFDAKLRYLMKWYGITNATIERKGVKASAGFEAILKINAIQEALSCCGVDNYTDYKDIVSDINFYPKEALKQNYSLRTNTAAEIKHRELDTLPHTCCKPSWMANIYCTEGLDNPKLTNYIIGRLNPNGCVKEAKRLCDNILYLLNITTIRAILFRFLFFMVVTFLYRQLKHMFEQEENAAFEALLEMQRPRLPGFDLAEGMLKLKPISSKTQALPGELHSKLQLEQMAIASATGVVHNPKMARSQNVWDEKQRRENVKLYKTKTKEFRRVVTQLIREKIGDNAPLPKEVEPTAKKHHHHHQGGGHHRHSQHHHHHHRSQEDKDADNRDNQLTLPTKPEIVPPPPPLINEGKSKHKQHANFGTVSKALSGLTPYLGRPHHHESENKGSVSSSGAPTEKVRIHRYEQQGENVIQPDGPTNAVTAPQDASTTNIVNARSEPPINSATGTNGAPTDITTIPTRLTDTSLGPLSKGVTESILRISDEEKQNIAKMRGSILAQDYDKEQLDKINKLNRLTGRSHSILTERIESKPIMPPLPTKSQEELSAAAALSAQEEEIKIEPKKKHKKRRRRKKKSLSAGAGNTVTDSSTNKKKKKKKEKPKPWTQFWDK